VAGRNSPSDRFRALEARKAQYVGRRLVILRDSTFDVERGGNIQAWLLWGLLFGSIGLGLFIYGRNQRTVVPLVCGVALMVFPYLVSNVVLLVGIGALLIAIPYFFRL
jgi:hypothetical protein